MSVFIAIPSQKQQQQRFLMELNKELQGTADHAKPTKHPEDGQADKETSVFHK